MSELENVVVVIAAYNEEKKIAETINDLRRVFTRIIVVDDGSVDQTASIAEKLGVTILRHPINLGQGAAIQTGIKKALTDPDTYYVLTFDADGQHSIKSAREMISVAETSGVDLVLGSRFLDNTHYGMPLNKKLILKLGIVFTRFDTGLKVTDVHNGLRVMNRSFAESLSIQKFGMAHASEILSHAKKINAKWIECPVEIFYTDYSMKKGQSVFNAINILTEMLHK